jgi:hypothetical protein
MLPVELRAGTEYSHPHALFQLLLDASDDGVIDHHVAHGVNGPAGHQHDASGADFTQRPDVPELGDFVQASGGLVVLLTLVAVLLLPPAGPVRLWPSPRRWRGRLLAPEPPPPRYASV